MIVVSILGILAAVAVPKFTAMMERSREGATKGNLSVLNSAITIYYGDNTGVWPNDLEGWFSTGGTRAYLDCIPAVKVTGRNRFNLVVPVNPSGGMLQGCDVSNGPNDSAYLGAGWRYESASGNLWVNSTLLDSYGLSYTTYGYF
jgi:general secretion pathway protein G